MQAQINNCGGSDENRDGRVPDAVISEIRERQSDNPDELEDSVVVGHRERGL